MTSKPLSVGVLISLFILIITLFTLALGAVDKKVHKIGPQYSKVKFPQFYNKMDFGITGDRCNDEFNRDFAMFCDSMNYQQDTLHFRDSIFKLILQGKIHIKQ